MSLPADVVLEAWPPDTIEKLGGYIQLAGLDLDALFLPRAVKGHPWVGQTVRFPYPEVGEGRITDCLINPRGYLTFDVFFADPVPPIHWRGRPFAYELVLVDNPTYHQQIHRFSGRELLELSQTGDGETCDSKS